MKTFRDLLIWQKSMKLVSEIYNISKEFPKEEAFGLTSQIRRCAVSIPSNISEGFGRDGVNDYLRFLNIAMASLFELQTQIEIAFNLKFIKKDIFYDFYEKTREVERMLSSFIRKIKEKKK